VSGILRSFQKLLNKDINNHLQIVSDGDLDPFIKYAEEIGIPNNCINFVGTQTSSQIAEWLHQSNAFILFSNFENLPLVIIEAFSTGTPVIASDVGGIKERFPDGGGIIIPRKDEDALLNAMIELKKNYQKYDKNMISEYARNNFSYKAIGSQFDHIYQNIIKSKHA
jgi:glycosyltransferase involved in cell wall biosynthesis